jgi:hypothetical protein
MRKNYRRSLALQLRAATLALFSAGALPAQTLTATFTGTVSSVSGSTNWAALGITVGSPWTMTATYSNSPDSSGSPRTGEMLFDFTTHTISASIGNSGIMFSTTGVVVHTLNDAPFFTPARDGFEFGNISSFTQNGVSVEFMTASLMDTSHTVMSSTAITAVTNYPFSSFNLHSFDLTLSNGDFIGGNITSYSIIPEPCTYAALISLAGLAAAVWRRRSLAERFP